MLTKQGVFGGGNVLGIGDTMTDKAQRLPAAASQTAVRQIGGGLFRHAFAGAMTKPAQSLPMPAQAMQATSMFRKGGVFRSAAGSVEFPTPEEEAVNQARYLKALKTVGPGYSIRGALQSLVKAQTSQAAAADAASNQPAAAASENWIGPIPNAVVLVGGVALLGGGLWMALRK